MIDVYLFEIECAEAIGAYKIADSLNDKLIKIANNSHKSILKQIEKKINKTTGIKDISFSNSQQKFIVSAEPNVLNSVKREIRSLAEPYNVSFRYSHKTIDELMMGNNTDPLDRHLSQLPEDGYITLDEFDNLEPSDLDLDLEEVPEDSLSEDPFDLDQLLLQHARDDMRKNHGI